jgi:hypothetical protein
MAIASVASSSENVKIMENAKKLDRGYNKIYRINLLFNIYIASSNF